MPTTLSRRAFVAGGALTALGLARAERVSALIGEVARGALPGGAGRFLSHVELANLRALTARLVPGPPEDPGPGALEVHAAEAIDLLLGAFQLDPPLIHAGGPFSDRAGAARDDFTDFVALDPQTEFSWRIRLEGSRGLPEREFAGPVLGLQEIYRLGLARLDALARAQTGGTFGGAPGATQDELIASHNAAVRRLVTATMHNTLEALCGPPEYGGNHGLAGWRGLQWRGDAEPNGFTASQVTEPDPPDAVVAAAGLETRHAVLARIAPLLAASGRGGAASYGAAAGGAR